MTMVQSLLALGGIFLLACCSPGPVFLLIASTAARHGRSAGIRVGLGVAAATFVWASCVALGLGAVLSSVVWANTALRLAAGLYLLWLGIGMIRGGAGREAVRADPPPLRRSALTRGFVASITNPKALAFFGSAFALTAPAQATVQYHLAAVLGLTVLSALWHGFLAVAFAAPAMQRGYRSFRRRIDLVAGVVLACLGGGMLWQGLRRS